MPTEPNQNPLEYSQSSFLGGINQQVDPTRLPTDSYFLLINGRVRRDVVEPIKLPLDLSSQSPAGNYQALFATASIAILVVDGKVYIKDYETNPDGGFVSIPDFPAMDATVDTIYAVIIPAVSSTLGRKNVTTSGVAANSTAAGNAVVNTPDLAGLVINGNSAGLLLQDGKNQPRFIDVNGQARVTQEYSAWTLANREYVPVGKQMIESDGILYIVSSDGLTIYRSVSGRFLDFVVSINQLGQKTADATTTSYSVSRHPITAINAISGLPGIFVSTKQVSYLMMPDYDDLIFNEPTFSKQFLFDTGVLNQVSTVDLNGDTGFIDYVGIRSFNATKQLLIESNNTPLSAPVSKLFIKINQSVTATVDFDDYALFACDTVYGPGILVYDKTIDKFVSLDLYPDVGNIKQFATIKTSTGRKLLFITTGNKIYEAFASNITAKVQFYAGEYCTNDPSREQKVKGVNLVFIDSLEVGIVSASLYVDREFINKLNKNIEQTIEVDPTPPFDIPFSATEKDSVQVIGFNFEDDSHAGWKAGLLFEWACDTKLSHIRMEAEQRVQNKNSLPQQAKVYSEITA